MGEEAKIGRAGGGQMEAALQQALKDAHDQQGGVEGISFQTFQEVLGKEESDLADFDPRLRKASGQEAPGGKISGSGAGAASRASRGSGALLTSSKASQGCGCTIS